MASKLAVGLQSKAVEASKIVAKNGSVASKLVGLQSKATELQSKAAEASKFVANSGSSYYRKLLDQNKQYIQEPATVEKCDLLAKQLFYTRLSSIPGRYEAFWKEVDSVKHLWSKTQEIKIEDVGIATLFGLECFAWFCAGEIIGRGFTLTGYSV